MSAADEYPLWPETAIEFRSNPTMLARRFGSCFAEYFVGSIPRVSAQTLALCRIFLGLWVTYFWLAWSGWSPSVLDDLAREGPRRSITKLIESKSQFLTYLSTDPFNRATVYWAIVILLLAFIVGIWTRILYPLLVGLLWVAALLANEDHFLTPLLLGMTATLFVPWSERWSVDRLVNGRRMDTSVAGPYYGYGIWLLGLVIGLTYMTAGLSKLVITDGGWLWDTGVRSGFIRDLYHAPTDWGMTVNNYYLLALGASMLSAFGQGIYVYACFTRSALIKAGIGLFIALPFLIGLVLFMGLFWWPWVVLVFILYIPWHKLDTVITRNRIELADFGDLPGSKRHLAWFLVTALALIGVHIYAAISKTDYEPLFSNYPMYAERLRAGSEREARLLNHLRADDESAMYRRSIQLVSAKPDGTTETRDLTQLYSTAWFLTRYQLWAMDLVGLNPDLVYARAANGDSLGSSCSVLRSIGAAVAGVGLEARSLRYFKRYFGIVDGKLTWLPVTNWIEVDLTERDCPYKQISGTPE